MPKETKYKFAITNLNKNIIYHKKFIEDAKNTTTNYVADEIIGKGGASVVYKGVNKDNNDKIIIKELKTTNINKLIREVNILKLTKGIPNVIRLLILSYSFICKFVGSVSVVVGIFRVT